MKNRQIWLIALLIVAIAGPLFAQGVAEPTAATGPVDLELWYGAAITEAGPPPDDWVAYQIIRDKLNINLKITALPSNEADQDVKISAAAAADNLPDIFMVRRETWLRLINQGLVAETDDLYAKMPTRTKVQYDDDSIAFTTINGKSYGLASPGSIAKNEGVLIRKDWLDKLGLAVPKTTEEFMNVMKAFTFNDPDGNGKNDTYGYGAFIEINNYEEGLGRRMDPWFGAFGVAGTWNLTKANFGLNVRKSAYYDAMVFIKRMIDEGVIDPNWLSYKKDDFRAAWKQGRFGIMREQNAAYAATSNYAPFDKNFPNGEWVIVDPPKGPNGHASVGVYTKAFRIYAISDKADATKRDAIARLLEWMSSDEGYFLLGWGVEGTNYTLKDGIPVAEGVPDKDYAFTGPKGQPYTQLRNMVFYNGQVELVSRYPTYVTAVSKKTMSALDVLFDMQTRAWTANIGGDTLPPPSTDLKRFYEQGVAEFLTGRRVLNKANWEAWVAEFDKLGGKAWEDSARVVAETNGLLR
ncbi:MAG: extracellular solute-binding protein [Sphaerochaetaceae bacterium]|jgi:putative aldouronate transport system substrate-binding protein|nr:extracellular solute-binding protein [Sphaerochaetaceae bacterium]MDX9809080.1 extracellular solute-binding protein [Sphaerochaetaceae bacterium]NLV84379.1 extracellular solute-binding protein [Spirochaetales bacterium]